MRELGPFCPACGHPTSSKYLFWGLGKPFDCRRCGSRLVIDRRFLPTLIALTAFWAFRPEGNSWRTFGLFLLIFAGLLLYSMFLMKPRRIDEEA